MEIIVIQKSILISALVYRSRQSLLDDNSPFFADLDTLVVDWNKKQTMATNKRNLEDITICNYMQCTCGIICLPLHIGFAFSICLSVCHTSFSWGFHMISWGRIELGSSILVCDYITLGASMGLQMVDLDPLFKFTDTVDLFSVLWGFRMISWEKMKLGSSNFGVQVHHLGC